MEVTRGMREGWKIGRTGGQRVAQNLHSDIPKGCSLFECQVATADAFQVTVLGAQQQRAVFSKRLGPATDSAVAGANDDVAADGCAMLLPLVGDRGEAAGTGSIIVGIQLPQDTHSEIGARHLAARFRLQGGGNLPQFGREVCRI